MLLLQRTGGSACLSSDRVNSTGGGGGLWSINWHTGEDNQGGIWRFEVGSQKKTVWLTGTNSGSSQPH